MKHKYNAQKVVYDGIKFDSKKEGKRYLDLKLLEKAGEISNLRLQVPYALCPAVYYDKCVGDFALYKCAGKYGFCIQRATKYIADFVYIRYGEEVVEDSKGFRTKVYKKKANQMKKLYGIVILET